MATHKFTQVAPAAAVTQVTTIPVQTVPVRAFDLAGTSIERWQDVNLDVYRGSLPELLACGIVRKDQLPPEGKDSISWRGGERVRTRCLVDETYLRVWVIKDRVIVAYGVSPAVQQERRHAKQRTNAEYRASLEHKRQAAAAKELADVPRSKEAYRRDMAKTARVMMMVAAKHAAEASAFHGFQIDGESMEEIHARIDDVIEAFLTAQVQFDAARQAAVIAAHQRKILEASPSLHARVQALTKADPSILQGGGA